MDYHITSRSVSGSMFRSSKSSESVSEYSMWAEMYNNDKIKQNAGLQISTYELVDWDEWKIYLKLIQDFVGH